MGITIFDKTHFLKSLINVSETRYYASDFGNFGREIRIVIGDNYYIYPQVRWYSCERDK